MDANKTLKRFVDEHPTLVEDLRVAAGLLPKYKRSILVHSLLKYADELAEYDETYKK